MPRTITIYLHADKDVMFEKGESLGLNGEALGRFKYACCEVEIELEVEDDGIAEIVAVDGLEIKRNGSGK